MSAPSTECPHGFPGRYVKRCPDCRRERQRIARAAREAAQAAARRAQVYDDPARRAAGDRPDPDP